MNEFDFFEKGNLGLPVFDIGICKIGMLVCFDWVFPEVWRILALKGADVICHPSNLVLPYAQQAVPVHGMINRTFNITANRCGTERGISFSGQSIISDPFGKTLYKASPNKDEVKIIELDLTHSRNKQITKRNHAFDDRRPKNYKEILKY
jgi:predicted amidohydrolase